MLVMLLALLLQQPGYLKSGVACCSYVDAAVVDGKTYTYYVESVNASSASAPSNTAIAVVPNDGKTHTVTLNWNAGAGATFYAIYRTSAPTALSITTK